MADTVVVDLPTTWTLLADGQQDGLVQLRRVGVAEIVKGSAAPADDDGEYGHLISTNGEPAFAWSGLTASDKIYGRSLSDEALRVAVTTLPPAS